MFLLMKIPWISSSNNIPMYHTAVLVIVIRLYITNLALCFQTGRLYLLTIF